MAIAEADQSKEMAGTHAARWFTLRHNFIDRLGNVIRTAHDCDTVVNSLLDRFSVQFLQARVPEGKPFGHIHSPADDFDVCARFTFAGCFQSGIELA